jgi:glycosyltransferase involved in cell wall biosynthesis
MSLRRPAFSVITPTYNRAAVLVRAIRSVQAQTLTDYEHLIIDDASTDDTAQQVARLEDPRIRYVRLDRWQGANAARNVGVALARAEWLTFLDSDDEYLPHRLETLQERIRTSPHPLLLSSFLTIKRGQPRPAINPSRLLSPHELEAALMAHTVLIAGSAITVRRQMLHKVGGFDPSIRRMQDRELLLRLAQHCGASLSDEVDWRKHPSKDSISGPARGYLAALAALAEAHPMLAQRYRTLLGYHVARRLLADALAGRWEDVVRSLRENRRAPTLRFSPWALLRSYLEGSRLRRNLARQLWTPPATLPLAPRAYPLPADLQLEAQPVAILQRAA